MSLAHAAQLPQHIVFKFHFVLFFNYATLQPRKLWTCLIIFLIGHVDHPKQAISAWRTKQPERP